MLRLVDDKLHRTSARITFVYVTLYRIYADPSFVCCVEQCYDSSSCIHKFLPSRHPRTTEMLRRKFMSNYTPVAVIAQMFAFLVKVGWDSVLHQLVVAPFSRF